MAEVKVDLLKEVETQILKVKEDGGLISEEAISRAATRINNASVALGVDEETRTKALTKVMYL